MGKIKPEVACSLMGVDKITVSPFERLVINKKQPNESTINVCTYTDLSAEKSRPMPKYHSFITLLLCPLTFHAITKLDQLHSS